MERGEIIFYSFDFIVSSSPVDVPQIKYGVLNDKATKNATWSWLNVSSPIFKCSDKVNLFVLYNI